MPYSSATSASSPRMPSYVWDVIGISIGFLLSFNGYSLFTQSNTCGISFDGYALEQEWQWPKPSSFQLKASLDPQSTYGHARCGLSLLAIISLLSFLGSFTFFFSHRSYLFWYTFLTIYVPFLWYWKILFTTSISNLSYQDAPSNASHMSIGTPIKKKTQVKSAQPRPFVVQ